MSYQESELRVADEPARRLLGAMTPAGLSHRFAAVALALLLLCVSSAQAETPTVDDGRSDWYVALSGFHVMPRDSDTIRLTDFGRVTGETAYGSTVVFAAALGTRVTDNVRLELELAYAPVDIEAMADLRVDGRPIDVPFGLTGDSDVWGLTVAASYDVPTQGPVRPYVGAGVGISHHECCVP